MTELHSVLMRRDDMTAEEAADTIAELRRRVLAGENPEELLHCELGLEPDYVFDLL
ncbi:MAG: hypothetical protein LBT97_02380 [Planctomycetota bacterium]|jgi:hypothetical protein|nr:hypothetical protein [Planctomycetota bacterium]